MIEWKYLKAMVKWAWAPVVLTMLFLSCQNDKLKNDSVCSTNDLNGNWGLIQYFDSIQLGQSISKYRMKELSWHTILLNIDGDSCFAIGSIYESKSKINQCNDTLLKFNDFPDVKDSDWSIYNVTRENQHIVFRKINNGEYDDTTTYIFRRMNDFQLDLTKDRRKIRYQFDSLVTNHFNNTLLQGKYVSLSGDTIFFKNNGVITGLREFEQYKIRNYFGTYHPFHNQDVVDFIIQDEFYPFNWTFKSDTLYLKDFIRNRSTEYFDFGKDEIILKKIKGME